MKDRPGHDFKYAINSNKIQKKFNWQPKKSFEEGIWDTVKWYLDNKTWWNEILKKKYKLRRIGIIK